VLDAGVDAALVLRYDWDGDTIVTAHNLARRAATAEVRIADAADGAVLRDLRQSARPIRLRKGMARIPLRAYDHRWFRLT
jgi:hypothetical protein